MTDLQPTKKRNNDIVNTLMGALLLIAMVAGLFFMSDGSGEIVTTVDMSDSLLAEQSQLPAAQPTVDPSFVDAASIIVEAPALEAAIIETPANESTLIDSTFIMLGVGLLIVIALIGWLLSRIRKPSNVAKTGTVEAGPKAKAPKRKTDPTITHAIAAEVKLINDLFVKHEINAKVKSSHVTHSDTGNFVRYPITGDARVTQIKGMSPDLSVAISDLRNADVVVKIREPRLVIELPYPLQARPLMWEDAPLDELKPFQALWGIDYSQDPPEMASIDYNKKTTSNDLVSGATGSGKTSAAITKIISLAYSTPPDKATFIVVDYKQDEDLACLSGLPHVVMLHSKRECIKGIRSACAEHMNRKGNKKDSQVFLIIDEFASLMDAITDEEVKEEVQHCVSEIARAGRSRRVRLTLITQKSLVDIVSSEVKGNLPHRLAGKTLTQEESKIATGLDGIGCERLPGAGSYYYINDGVASRIQGFYLPEDRRFAVVGEIAEKWSGVKAYRIPMVDALPDEASDLDDELGETTTQSIFPTEGFDSNLFEPETALEPVQAVDPIEELISKYGKDIVAAWIDERDQNGGKISGAKITAIHKEMTGKGLDGTTAAKIRGILCSNE